MRCPECGAEFPNNLCLCPVCGEMVQETRPTRPTRGDIEKTRPMQALSQVLSIEEPAPAPAKPIIETGDEPEPRTKWQRVRSILLWVLVFLFVVAVVVGGAGYFGLHKGEEDRLQQRQELAEQHYRAGIARLDAGEFELAIAEFEYVLEINPDHKIAGQGIAEAQARIAAMPTSTPTLQASAVFTIAVEDLYQRATAHFQAGEWQDAAAVLTQLRKLDTEYEAFAVEEMLFNSLHNAGMALLDADRLEEGVFYLDQAIALRPLDEETVNQRNLAVKYMTALGYWGADWERCIERFEELYALAPNYKDIVQRLYRAHVTYGDAWVAQGEMCPAEEQYALALQIINDPALEEKRAEAEQVCLTATPTPIAPIEGTKTITLTQLPLGFTTGKLAYPVYNTETGIYDVYALFSESLLIQRMDTGADQPCWVRATGALGYRDRLSLGASLLMPGETEPRQLTASAAAWPTFSPDGNRMAYATQDAAGTWQIYTQPTNGSSPATFYAQGKGPAWGPNGWLAWTGCDASGECGIFVDNPDDDQAPTIRSHSVNDIALSWSPDGGMLAYMSNHTGDWNIYTYSLSGGFEEIVKTPDSDEGLPTWSPDGSKIAFVSNQDGIWGLYLMNRNGDDAHKILSLGPSMPDWTMQRLSWAP